MAKSKSYFGDYSMSGIGKVFGGKPSARSRRQSRKDTAEFGGLLLPAILVAGYFMYKKKQNASMTETIDASKNVIVKR
jgi:hypothetical protein